MDKKSPQKILTGLGCWLIPGAFMSDSDLAELLFMILRGG